MAENIAVELVFALPDEQWLLELSLPAGATVAEVLDAADVLRRIPGVDIASLPVGVWGRVCDRTVPVEDGDRIEIYRELEIDPREARRQLALSGRTMRETRVSATAPGHKESR